MATPKILPHTNAAPHEEVTRVTFASMSADARAGGFSSEQLHQMLAPLLGSSFHTIERKWPLCYSALFIAGSTMLLWAGIAGLVRLI